MRSDLPRDDMNKMGLESDFLFFPHPSRNARDKNEYIAQQGRPDVAASSVTRDVATAEARA